MAARPRRGERRPPHRRASRAAPTEAGADERRPRRGGKAAPQVEGAEADLPERAAERGADAYDEQTRDAIQRSVENH